MKKQIFVILSLLISINAVAQIQNNDAIYFFDFKIGGAYTNGISPPNSENLNTTPRGGLKLNVTVGRKLFNRFNASIGLKRQVYSFDTQPFLHSVSIQGESGPYESYANYPSKYRYTKKIISLPISIEYRDNQKKFTPYAGLSIEPILYSNAYRNRIVIHSNELINREQTDKHHGNITFGLSTGIALNLPSLSLSFGVYGDYEAIIINESQNRHQTFTLGLEFGIRKPFIKEPFRKPLFVKNGYKYYISNDEVVKYAIDSVYSNKRHHIYEEAFGGGSGSSSIPFSTNYEYTLIDRSKFNLNLRAGITISNVTSYGWGVFGIPLGVKLFYGKRNQIGFVTGYTIAPTKSDKSLFDYYHIGIEYRFITKRQIVIGISGNKLFEPTPGWTRYMLGFTLGYRF